MSMNLKIKKHFTSGTGSLGKYLVRYILMNEQPKTVRIFDDDATEHREFQQELIGHKDLVQFLLGDV